MKTLSRSELKNLYGGSETERPMFGNQSTVNGGSCVFQNVSMTGTGNEWQCSCQVTTCNYAFWINTGCSTQGISSNYQWCINNGSFLP